MKTYADFAAMSDPDKNPHFCRRWEGPPPAPQRQAPRTLERLAAEIALDWKARRAA